MMWYNPKINDVKHLFFSSEELEVMVHLILRLQAVLLQCQCALEYMDGTCT